MPSHSCVMACTPSSSPKRSALSGDDAAQALSSGKIDAAFLTGDNAQPAVLAFLRQPVNERTAFAETRVAMERLGAAWPF